MSGFPKKERQRIVDEYLQKTGRNMFVPGEFVDWLKEQPSHEAYEWFYGMDDGEAARSTASISPAAWPVACVSW
jgi:hypothetical protein